MSELIELQIPKQGEPVNVPLTGADQLPDIEHRFGFRIGRYRFVMEKTLITEILIKPTIYKIPNSPVWIFGMINLRGNILPVIDFSHALGLQYTNNPGDFVLVINKGREAMALLVDALPKLLANPVSAEQLSESSHIAREFVKPGIQYKEDIWDQLDIKKLAMTMKGNA